MITPLVKVLNLKDKHRHTWRDKPAWYWYLGLFEEVVELALALMGIHKDKPEWELMQIAAICLNWLDMEAGESKDEIPF